MCRIVQNKKLQVERVRAHMGGTPIRKLGTPLDLYLYLYGSYRFSLILNLILCLKREALARREEETGQQQVGVVASVHHAGHRLSALPHVAVDRKPYLRTRFASPGSPGKRLVCCVVRGPTGVRVARRAPNGLGRAPGPARARDFGVVWVRLPAVLCSACTAAAPSPSLAFSPPARTAG
jgi:hypothetical protein